MILSPRSLPLPLALLGLVVLSGGCSKKQQPAMPPGGPAPMPAMMQGPGGMANRETGKIMAKIGRGKQSLNEMIRQELNAGSTEWDSIQPKAKEYAQLAADLGKHDPPKGDKEAWKKYTAAFAGDAAALDRAAQAKNLDDAKKASEKLTNSCTDCHREHRGGPGRGGPGGPGGRRRGGPKGAPPA